MPSSVGFTDRMKWDIWHSASAEDYINTTASTGEPVLTTMAPEDATKESSGADTIASAGLQEGCSAYNLWRIQKKRADIRQEYLDHWAATVSETGTGRPVDALITPMAPYAAPPHGTNT